MKSPRAKNKFIPLEEACCPIAQRTLAIIKNGLHYDGDVAFLLGSGVDQQLGLDAGGRTIPSWRELLISLPPFLSREGEPGWNESEIKKMAEKWPNATASLARAYVGDIKFAKRINVKLRNRRPLRLKLDKGFTKILSELLLKSNLIVTTNYSDHISNLVRMSVKADNLKVKKNNRRAKKHNRGVKKYEQQTSVVVLDREDLASFRFPDAEKKPKTIFIIHLHGRCSDRSFPVLDAWGYDVARHDDRQYASFLETLFTRRHVVTIGISWRDIPLQETAAFVHRTKAYSTRKHLSFDYAEVSKEQLRTDRQPASLERAMGAAVRAVYGVDRIQSNEDDQSEVLKALKPSPDKVDEFVKEIRTQTDPDKRIERLAEFLDEAGDYESPLHHHLLASLCQYGDAKRTAKDAVVWLDRHVFAALKPQRVDIVTWCFAARIERHLRHHWYVYAQGDERRTRLWKRLEQRKPKAQDFGKILNQRLRFDFLVGQYELSINSPNLVQYRDALPTVFGERLGVASRLWPPERQTASPAVPKERGDLPNQLLDLGWEAMAAKTLCDSAGLLAKRCKSSGFFPKQVCDMANRAEAVARSAGCFRRQVKADVFAAVWSGDPLQGRLRLLSHLRAAESTHAIEPILLAGIAAGLLACQSRILRYAKPASEVRGKLKGQASDLLAEAGLRFDDHKSNIRYWTQFFPKEERKSVRSLL